MSASTAGDRGARRMVDAWRPAGARAGVARSRRPGRRRLRGPRRRVHATLGCRRTGHHAPHVGGARPPRRGRPATGTTSSAGEAATACSRVRPCPSCPGEWGAPTRWSRSGTECRGSRRSGIRRRPRITILHHVHGPMWDQIMPGPLGPAGRLLEARARAALLPSRRDRHAIRVDQGRASRPRLPTGSRHRGADNGVDPFFNPGDERSRRRRT